MRDVEELHAEAARGDLVFIFDDVELGFFKQSVLLELVLDELYREARAVDRNIQVRKNERKRSNVILVAVRKKDRPNFALTFEQVGDIGNNDRSEERRVG